MIDWPAAERKLREVSQLAALFERLPHVLTQHERGLLQEFDEFRTGRRPACSHEAALAGLRTLWARGDPAAIVQAVRKLPWDLRSRDREVRTWFVNARLLVGEAHLRQKERARLEQELNDLLNEWDPIGVADQVDDEYSDYREGLLSLLASGTDETHLAAELTAITTGRMGLSARPERDLLHARAIVGWYRRQL